MNLRMVRPTLSGYLPCVCDLGHQLMWLATGATTVHDTPRGSGVIRLGKRGKELAKLPICRARLRLRPYLDNKAGIITM